MKRSDIITRLNKKILKHPKGSIIFLGGGTQNLVGKRAVIFVMSDDYVDPEMNSPKGEPSQQDNFEKELERKLYKR